MDVPIQGICGDMVDREDSWSNLDKTNPTFYHFPRHICHYPFRKVDPGILDLPK